jgi:hypothetical protein
MKPEEIIELARKHGFMYEFYTGHPDDNVFQFRFLHQELIAFATEIRNRTLDEAADYMESNDAGYAHNIRALKGDEK